jgi:ribosomal protein S18 acetylase RimI-like enzyme
MNIRIRNYEEKDLSFVESINFLLSLEFKFHREYIKENIFTAVDENDNAIGVASISFHSTWHAMDKDILHKLQYDIAVDEENQFAGLAKGLLMDKLIEKFNTYKAEYTGKKLCICGWCDADDISEIQFLLTKGFAMSSVTPVLKYDLTKEIKHYEIPENITIEQYPINGNTVDKFIEATAAANNGIADSKGELLFRSGGQGFKVFTASDNGKIVSSVTLWDIGQGRGATENIFTIPDYRRKNIAREIIAKGLQSLKDDGQKIATLSMDGKNLSAMKLYLSIGYELMYNTIEMRFEG